MIKDTVAPQQLNTLFDVLDVHQILANRHTDDAGLGIKVTINPCVIGLVPPQWILDIHLAVGAIHHIHLVGKRGGLHTKVTGENGHTGTVIGDHLTLGLIVDNRGDDRCLGAGEQGASLQATTKRAVISPAACQSIGIPAVHVLAGGIRTVGALQCDVVSIDDIGHLCNVLIDGERDCRLAINIHKFGTAHTQHKFCVIEGILKDGLPHWHGDGGAILAQGTLNPTASISDVAVKQDILHVNHIVVGKHYIHFAALHIKAQVALVGENALACDALIGPQLAFGA